MAASLDDVTPLINTIQQQVSDVCSRTTRLESILGMVIHRFQLDELLQVDLIPDQFATTPLLQSVGDSNRAPRSSCWSEGEVKLRDPDAILARQQPLLLQPRFSAVANAAADMDVGTVLKAPRSSGRRPQLEPASAADGDFGSPPYRFLGVDSRQDLEVSTDQGPSKGRGGETRTGSGRINSGSNGAGGSGWGGRMGRGLHHDHDPCDSPAWLAASPYKSMWSARDDLSAYSASSTVISLPATFKPPPRALVGTVPRAFADQLCMQAADRSEEPLQTYAAARGMMDAFRRQESGGAAGGDDDGAGEGGSTGGAVAQSGRAAFPELGSDGLLSQILDAVGSDPQPWISVLAAAVDTAGCGSIDKYTNRVHTDAGSQVAVGSCTPAGGQAPVPSPPLPLPAVVTGLGLGHVPQAALVLMLQCREHLAARTAVSKSPNCLRAIAEILTAGSPLEQRIAAHVFWFAGRSHEGGQALYTTRISSGPAAQVAMAPAPGLIGVLVAATGSRDAHTAKAAALALHNAIVAEGCAQAVKAAGGCGLIPALLDLVAASDDISGEAAAATLAAVAERSESLRMEIIAAEGVEALSKLLSCGDLATCGSAAGALEHLTLEVEGAARLVACGGVRHVMELLRHGVGEAPVRAVGILRNVADVAECHHAMLRAGMLPLLVAILAAPPPVAATQSGSGVTPCTTTTTTNAQNKSTITTTRDKTTARYPCQGGFDEGGGGAYGYGGGPGGVSGSEEGELAHFDGAADGEGEFNGGARCGASEGEDGDGVDNGSCDDTMQRVDTGSSSPSAESAESADVATEQDEAEGEEGEVDGKADPEDEEQDEEEGEADGAYEVRVQAVNTLVNLATRGQFTVRRVLARAPDCSEDGDGMGGGGLWALLSVVGHSAGWDAETVAWALQGILALTADGPLRADIVRQGALQVLQQVLLGGSPRQQELAAQAVANLTSGVSDTAKVAIVEGGAAVVLVAMLRQGTTAVARLASCCALQNLARCPACRAPLLAARAAEALTATAIECDTPVAAAAIRALYNISCSIRGCKDLVSRGSVSDLLSALRRFTPDMLPWEPSPFGYGTAAVAGGPSGYDSAAAGGAANCWGSVNFGPAVFRANVRVVELLAKVLKRLALYSDDKGIVRQQVQAALASASIL